MDNSYDDLANNIYSAVQMDRPNSTGWMACYCPACGESRKKTGGWKIDTETIGFHCFKASCTATSVYEKDQPVSKKFKELMATIGVTIPVELRMKKSSLQLKIQKELEQELYTEHSYKNMSIPEHWTPIRTRDVELIKFFDDRRCDPTPLYVIRDGFDKDIGAYPMYYFNKLIGFQLINPFGDGPKYRTHTKDNSGLLLINQGKLQQKPILVEGVMDSLSFPSAVGSLSHNISKEQAFILRGKDVHLFPDNQGGEKYLDAMKRYGWKMIVPSWNNVSDLNDCVVKYGLLATARMMREHIFTDPIKARVAYGFWSHNKES
jgi:hypothetical protein